MVLSGGGAKGAATVGVLKVLEEKGVHVDCIAGTSIGAIVGALYAAGYKADDLEKMFKEQDWIPLLTDFRDDLLTTPYKKIGTTYYIFGFPVYDEGGSGMGVLKANQVEKYIRDMLKEKKCETFKDLKIPFYCVATDMDSVREVVFHEDNADVTKAVRASMAIPAIFRSVEVDGLRLVDGGAVNNLPVDVLIKHEHPDILIVIDLTQVPPKKGEMESLQSLSIFIQFLADLIGVGNITKWFFTQPNVDSYFSNLALLRNGVDVYINPRLGNYSYASFSKDDIDDMLRMGEESARTEELYKQYLKIAAIQTLNQSYRERLQHSPFSNLLQLSK